MLRQVARYLVNLHREFVRGRYDKNLRSAFLNIDLAEQRQQVR
jgi:hypothetical protein